MKNSFLYATASALFLASTAVMAELPAGAPAGSTGACKDGSYTSNATKRGACAGHKGIKDWYAVETAVDKEPPTKEAKPSKAPNASSEESSNAPMMRAKAVAKTSDTAKIAEGGGPGKVWVNPKSKVYHCSGTKYYGTTKEGSYMTEAEAKTAGNHADHGKACS